MTTIHMNFRDLLKDTILALHYRKVDVVEFLKSCGCPNPLFKDFTDLNQTTKAAIIDHVFSQLSSRPDGGEAVFASIAHQLASFVHFDGYWFKKGELDAKTARERVDYLKLLLEQKRRENAEKAAKREEQAKKAKSQAILGELHEEFLGLFFKTNRITPQERGYRLEKLLIRLGEYFELEMTEPFKIVGEQIDGALKYDGEHYLLEAKWHDKPSACEALYKFAHKIQGKMYGRGIFLSISGYSEEVVKALVTGKAIRTILMDAEDLLKVLEGYWTLPYLLDRKIKAAQLRGQIYVNPEDLSEKIKTV